MPKGTYERSPEIREKNRQAVLRNYAQWEREGVVHPSKGRVATDDERRRNHNSHKTPRREYPAITDAGFANYFSGVTAGEGSFGIMFTKRQGNEPSKDKKWVLASFSIQMDYRDKPLLDSFREFLGVGAVSCNMPKERWPHFTFQVRGMRQLVDRLIPFFDQFPMRHARKQADYLVWREIVLMIDRGEHLDEAGRQKMMELWMPIKVERAGKGQGYAHLLSE